MEYTKEVLKHFMHPKNVGEIKNPDGIGKVGNIQCGDILQLFIRVGKNKQGKEFIKDIKFRTLGCASAIAVSSMITELAKGKTLDEAMKLTNADVVKGLRSLPPIKVHCSLLAEEALGEALHDYFKRQKREIPKLLIEKHKRAVHAEKEFHKLHGGVHQHE